MTVPGACWHWTHDVVHGYIVNVLIIATNEYDDLTTTLLYTYADGHTRVSDPHTTFTPSALWKKIT